MMRQACVLALLITAMFATPSQAQTALRWKFAKDQSFAVTCTQQTEVETSVNNKPRRAYLEMAMDLAWHVDDVDAEGVATMTQSFTRLQLKTTAPDADPVVYDSAAASRPTGAAKEVAASVAPLLKAKFVVTMDARGDVKKVELGDEAREAIEALPEGSQLKPLLTAEGLGNLFRLGGSQLPEKEVSAGDTWPANSETETPYGTLVQEGTFTYAGPQAVGDKQLHKVELESMAKLKPKAGAAITLKVQEQTKTGTLLFDTEAGHVVSSESKLTSKSVRPFRDTQIHVKISGTTKLEISRK